jgi:hypothetical protein
MLSRDDTISLNEMLCHLVANLRTISMVSIGVVVIIDSARCFVCGMFNVFIVIFIVLHLTKICTSVKSVAN